MGLHRYGVIFVHSEGGSRIGGQIDWHVIARAFLSVLLLTVLARPFIIGATYVVWSPIATDVVTGGMAFIEVKPGQASTAGQVNVTVTVYNVARLYAWQVGFELSPAINLAATIVPTENIFQNHEAVGLITSASGNVFMNCLLGPVDGIGGNGVLMQVAFQVDSLPAVFKMNPETTMLLDDSLTDIPYTHTAANG